jgi:hypothetical protein
MLGDRSLTTISSVAIPERILIDLSYNSRIIEIDRDL